MAKEASQSIDYMNIFARGHLRNGSSLVDIDEGAKELQQDYQFPLPAADTDIYQLS